MLSHAGPDALSVTTNLNINFMRKAGPGPIDGHCRILKLGKSLMVFDIDIVAGPDNRRLRTPPAPIRSRRSGQPISGKIIPHSQTIDYLLIFSARCIA